MNIIKWVGKALADTIALIKPDELMPEFNRNAATVGKHRSAFTSIVGMAFQHHVEYYIESVTEVVTRAMQMETQLLLEAKIKPQQSYVFP